MRRYKSLQNYFSRFQEFFVISVTYFSFLAQIALFNNIYGEEFESKLMKAIISQKYSGLYVFQSSPASFYVQNGELWRKNRDTKMRISDEKNIPFASYLGKLRLPFITMMIFLGDSVPPMAVSFHTFQQLLGLLVARVFRDEIRRTHVRLIATCETVCCSRLQTCVAHSVVLLGWFATSEMLD